MEEKKGLIKTKKQMFIVIGVFTLVMLLGTVTYAFFNYTRTGSRNLIKVGRISFNTTQNGTLNLTNVFPVASNSVGSDYTVDTLQIAIEGDTTYSEGIEYLVTAEEVNVETTTGKKVPMTLKVAVTDDLGTQDTDNDQIEYFTDRGSTTSYYKLLSESVLYDGQYLLVGYIAPGASGIDGTINIKAYLDNTRVAISDTYPEGEIRKVRTTGYDNTLCEGVLTGVSGASTICATATSLQTALDNGDLTTEQVNSLKAIGLIEEYTDGTTSTWVAGRTVLTTSEWNSLQGQGNELSFKVRVEANEGIWVDPATNPNAIGRIPSNLTSGITEIYFIKETPIRMERRYNEASVKGDLTDTTLNEGKVLAWQEENKLYIVSTGETYLPVNSGGYFSGLSNVTRIEFENINTSRVTIMSAMFMGCSSLNNLDLNAFDTQNVTDMDGMFINVGVSMLDLSVLDTRSVINMDGMVMNCSNLVELNLSGLGSNYLNDFEAGINCSKLKKIDMSNFNFGLIDYYDFSGNPYPKLEEVNLSNANTSNITSFSFYGNTTLKTIDLSGIDVSNITNMYDMFRNDSSLETIYVSNSWNVNNVTSSSKMFEGCTSLVGGQGTTYDASHVDKEYAHIDGGPSNPGYLTLKNN